MSRMPIDGQQHSATPAFEEILQKRNKRFRIELAGVSGGPELPAGINRADNIDALPLAGSDHHRGLALHPVGAAQRGVGLKARFVQKENLRTQPFGPPFKLWISLLQPELYRLGIPLIRPPQRLLR